MRLQEIQIGPRLGIRFVYTGRGSSVCFVSQNAVLAVKVTCVCCGTDSASWQRKRTLISAIIISTQRERTDAIDGGNRAGVNWKGGEAVKRTIVCDCW